MTIRKAFLFAAAVATISGAASAADAIVAADGLRGTGIAVGGTIRFERNF